MSPNERTIIWGVMYCFDTSDGYVSNIATVDPGFVLIVIFCGDCELPFKSSAV